MKLRISEKFRDTKRPVYLIKYEIDGLTYKKLFDRNTQLGNIVRYFTKLKDAPSYSIKYGARFKAKNN